MSQQTVAILGASRQREKFGNKSVRAHRDAGFRVYPINPKSDEIEGLTCYPSLADVPVERLDRVSVYLPPDVLLGMLPEIVAADPVEVWLNPGSDSDEIVAKARELGLNVIQACSIVGVGKNPSAF
jgi:predicted CoA-binding protein